MQFLAAPRRSAASVATGIRCYANAPAATPKPAAPPASPAPAKSASKMRLYGVSGRYAHALFDYASEQNAHAKVDADVKNLKKLATDNHEFQELLQNPITSQSARKNGLGKIFADQKTSETTRRFFDLLIENRRSANSIAIFDDYLKLLAGSRNELSGTITSAKPLTPKQLTNIEGSLKNVFQTGHSKIVLDTKVDPKLLGGFQVQLGEKYIDCSLRTEIDKIKRVMEETTGAYFEKKYAEIAANT